MEGDAGIPPFYLVMRSARITCTACMVVHHVDNISESAVLARCAASPLVHARKGFQDVPDSASKIIFTAETAAGFPRSYISSSSCMYHVSESASYFHSDGQKNFV